MAVYSVTFGHYTTVVRARDIRQARKWAREEFGRDRAPFAVKRADEDDVAWVEAMGGFVHTAAGGAT